MDKISIIKKMLELCYKALGLAKQMEDAQTEKGNKLYLFAKIKIGCSFCFNWEFGCAETVNNMAKEALGEEIGGDVSTYRMYQSLQNKKKFFKVSNYLPGDIIISPTGYGNGSMPNGHCGIISENQKIISNNSDTGIITENYNIFSWKLKYGKNGGFPVEFYRII